LAVVNHIQINVSVVSRHYIDTDLQYLPQCFTERDLFILVDVFYFGIEFSTIHSLEIKIYEFIKIQMTVDVSIMWQRQGPWNETQFISIVFSPTLCLVLEL
jgi:hypothetical protein